MQPCFNRDVICSLSDQATQALLDVSGWVEGDKMQLAPSAVDESTEPSGEGHAELDNQLLQAISTSNTQKIQECLSLITRLADAQERISRVFLATVEEASEEALRALLDTNQVNSSHEDEINRRNCLHKAAICGRLEVLQFGLACNVSVRVTDVYGRLPLHYACMHGHVQLVENLSDAGPDTIDCKDQENFTPLIHAIVHSQLACVHALLSKGAQLGPISPSEHIPLNLACQHGSAEIVELLLQGHAELVPDAEGLYPQHLVARFGKNPQMLLLLQRHGANLDQTDKLYQWTPLFHAASEGHVACLQILLQCGANVDATDEKGLCAMYYATWEGHLECIKLLASMRQVGLVTQPAAAPGDITIQVSTAPDPMDIEQVDGEGIPEFILPPPIIPFRRYGHNFLDTKTLIVISFAKLASDAIRFYDGQKYPAARLTVSSKSSDLIPRNLLLPIQDEYKVMSFQFENLDAFSIEFDIYPTFGSKVIARGIASSKVFTARAVGAGQWHVELFDPRLRAIGRISFDFRVVKPFYGNPLEISHFATYWKATSHIVSHPNALITGSSLSGEYVRLFVQLTADGVAVLYPFWKITHHGLGVPINVLTYPQLVALGAQHRVLGSSLSSQTLIGSLSENMSALHDALARSLMPLADALAALPPHIHVEVHMLSPSPAEQEQWHLGPPVDMNMFADAVLGIVFEHARQLRASGANERNGFVRSIVFSSFNPDMCTAVNWKQPNCKLPSLHSESSFSP